MDHLEENSKRFKNKHYRSNTNQIKELFKLFIFCISSQILSMNIYINIYWLNMEKV